MQLLVAQLQNQDPLNPTDSTQFVSQLAQFSQLEQTIAIRTDIESYAAKAEASQTAGAAGTDSGAANNGASGTDSSSNTNNSNGTAST